MVIAGNIDASDIKPLVEKYFGEISALGNPKPLDPTKMVYVVVGDARTQAERMKELGLGGPIMLDK